MENDTMIDDIEANVAELDLKDPRVKGNVVGLIAVLARSTARAMVDLKKIEEKESGWASFLTYAMIPFTWIWFGYWNSTAWNMVAGQLGWTEVSVSQGAAIGVLLCRYTGFSMERGKGWAPFSARLTRVLVFSPFTLALVWLMLRLGL